MSEPFGEEGEVFSYSLFLVLANRILTFCVAATFLWVSLQLYAPPVYLALVLSSCALLTSSPGRFSSGHTHHTANAKLCHRPELNCQKIS